jgi:hypothetical protein
MALLKPTQKDIDEVLDKCADLFDRGHNPWPGETYSAGVQAAILWLTGQCRDNPLDE